MANEITNLMLLENIQAMKSDLQQQIATLDRKIDRVDAKSDSLASAVQNGFEEARQHRQALQEELDATICLVAKHEVKLSRTS